MRTTTTWVAVMSLAAGSFGLRAAQETLPPADAQDVWTYITEREPYTEWDPWPGHDGFRPGTSPHGAFVRLYLNDPAKDAIESGESMPAGAIIVKENYGTERALQGITPMYRVEGFNPDAGNWFWAKYGPEGNVESSGKVQSCIECHGSADGGDWLFTE